jgi:hypothetical protein
MGTEENGPGKKGLQIKIDETNWGFKGKNYLFLIGIDQYQHWKPLKCAVKDVQDFADLVTSLYQFEKSDITILKDGDATEANILKAFNKLRQTITNEDNLVIYYSGHGHLIEDTGYWIPVGANFGDENEHEFINNSVILEKVQKINTLHTFLIVDACFSGSLMRGIKGSPPKSERYKSRRIFASGQHNEVVSDGIAGGNSPFASGILNELRNNTNPYIPVSKLIAEVSSYVQQEANQVPVDDRLRNSDDQGGDFIFHLRLSEGKIWETVKKLDSIEAYEKFIVNFPKSACIVEAGWLIAKKIGTRKALIDYMDKYPQGEFYDLADDLLKSLEEEVSWKAAKSKNVLSGYSRYLKDYPNGKYVKEAREIIKKLLEDEGDKSSGENREEGGRLTPPDPSLEQIAFKDIIWLDKLAEQKDRQKKEIIKLLKELIEKCRGYLEKYPAITDNFIRVKQIQEKSKLRLKRM